MKTSVADFFYIYRIIFEESMIPITTFTIWVSILIPTVKSQIYLYDARDNLQVEFYDCFLYESIKYCRRPSTPIDLFRDHDTMACQQNGGILHRFSQLRLRNVSITTLLHDWRSSLDRVEKYSSFLGWNDSCRDGELENQRFERKIIQLYYLL